MIYSVKARFSENKMPEFYHKLTDGTISSQKPDGMEIVDSMKRAKITEPNIIRWTETCYCTPPLKHERYTVYDNYLSEIDVRQVDDYMEFKGKPFIEYIEKLAKTAGDQQY